MIGWFNAAVFALLFVMWRRETWLNFMFKLVFLGLGVWNLYEVWPKTH